MMNRLQYFYLTLMCCGLLCAINCEDRPDERPTESVYGFSNVMNTFRQISTTIQDVIALLQHENAEGKDTYTKEELNSLMQ